jgi:hypothetical protein
MVYFIGTRILFFIKARGKEKATLAETIKEMAGKRYYCTGNK